MLTVLHHARQLAGLISFTLLLVVLPARAELVPQQIEAYVASLETVRPLADRLRAEGKESFLAQKIMPGAGERFDPHQRGLRVLQQDEPAYYRELSQKVRPHGFTSAESWAQVGDRVVLAYGAVKVAAESPHMLVLAQQVGPEQELMLQMLPPKERAQMQQALIIARAVAQVPAADRAAVKPYVARLDRLLNQP